MDLNDFQWIALVLFISCGCSFVAALVGELDGFKKIALHMLNGTIMAGIVFAISTEFEVALLARIGMSVAVAYIGIDGVIAKVRDILNIFRK